MTNITEKIYDLMTERNWTTYELAKQSGLSQSTISSIFASKECPKLKTLEKICKAFNIGLSEFFDDQKTLLSEFQTQFASLDKESQELLMQLVKKLIR